MAHPIPCGGSLEEYAYHAREEPICLLSAQQVWEGGRAGQYAAIGGDMDVIEVLLPILLPPTAGFSAGARQALPLAEHPAYATRVASRLRSGHFGHSV